MRALHTWGSHRGSSLMLIALEPCILRALILRLLCGGLVLGCRGLLGQCCYHHLLYLGIS
jgi:hypothetical protein